MTSTFDDIAVRRIKARFDLSMQLSQARRRRQAERAYNKREFLMHWIPMVVVCVVVAILIYMMASTTPSP